MVGFDMWNYWFVEHALAEGNTVTKHDGVDLTGFGVEALDGSIGKVDRASYETDDSSIVVDTGPWIFGRKVLLPAGIVDRIDAEEQKVYVHRTKDQIRDAPEYDELLAQDAGYRNDVGAYYGPEGPGFLERDDRPRPW